MLADPHIIFSCDAAHTRFALHGPFIAQMAEANYLRHGGPPKKLEGGMKALELVNESIHGRLLPAVERRQSANRYVWELLTQLAVIWVLVFGLLTVLLSFAVSPLNGALLDAARGATLVDAVMLILLKILPPK